MPYEEAVEMLKKSIKKMYGKKAIRWQFFFFLRLLTWHFFCDIIIHPMRTMLVPI